MVNARVCINAFWVNDNAKSILHWPHSVFPFSIEIRCKWSFSLYQQHVSFPFIVQLFIHSWTQIWEFKATSCNKPYFSTSSICIIHYNLFHFYYLINWTLICEMKLNVLKRQLNTNTILTQVAVYSIYYNTCRFDLCIDTSYEHVHAFIAGILYTNLLLAVRRLTSVVTRCSNVLHQNSSIFRWIIFQKIN